MTPTTPLAGVVFGLVAGLLMVVVVMAALYVPWRRPARAKASVQAWSVDERSSDDF